MQTKLSLWDSAQQKISCYGSKIQNKIVNAEYELELKALKVESDFWSRA